MFLHKFITQQSSLVSCPLSWDERFTPPSQKLLRLWLSSYVRGAPLSRTTTLMIFPVRCPFSRIWLVRKINPYNPDSFFPILSHIFPPPLWWSTIHILLLFLEEHLKEIPIVPHYYTDPKFIGTSHTLSKMRCLRKSGNRWNTETSPITNLVIKVKWRFILRMVLYTSVVCHGCHNEPENEHHPWEYKSPMSLTYFYFIFIFIVNQESES
jgi:hypothetical protein